jgi:hypothetical protein
MTAEPEVTGEHALLLSRLEGCRKHIFSCLDGVPEQALRESRLPSGWVPLGLVQHLALDVERFWFACAVAGDEAAIRSLDDPPDNAWIVSPDQSAGQILELYRQEIDRANAVIASTPLDQAPRWWPGELFGEWRLNSHRELVLHVIIETAAHAGHLDAWREMTDGRQSSVLT